MSGSHVSSPQPSSPQAPGGNDTEATEVEPPKVAPETLTLQAKPAPISRISKHMLYGASCGGLLVLAALLIVALQPPKFGSVSSNELYSTGRNATPEGLNNLPTTYDGVGRRKQAPPATVAAPSSTEPISDQPVVDREAAERSRLARLEIQARESGLFFRLQLKAAPRQDATGSLQPSGSAIAANAASEASPLRALPTGSRTDTGLANADGATDRTALSDPADQTRKLAFLKAGPEKDIYNPHGLQTPASPYQLMAGTIIAASLVSGLNSDLPGFVIAQVTEPVYDSATGRFLLIPQGTRLIGKYDSVIAYGQERALVVWQRLILPDGSSVVIDNLPATDTGGYAGLTDAVDQHTWKLLKGIALATVLGVGNSLAFGSTNSDLVKALRESTGQTTNRAGQRLIERDLNVQPTITIRPGWPLRVIVHKDLILKPYRAGGVRGR
jgi:type IV secretion system protein TrbI